MTENQNTATTEVAKVKRTLQGRVVSDKMQKTIVVLVSHKVKHALYGKYTVKSKKYHVHDETNQYNIGDLVEIVEGRPMSKTKTWVASRLIEANKLA
jgi:small subunit ribosomal protein S17